MATVADLISNHLSECAERRAVLAIPDALFAQSASRQVLSLASKIAWKVIGSAEPLIRSGRIARDAMTIELDPTALANAFGVTSERLHPHLLKARKRFVVEDA